MPWIHKAVCDVCGTEKRDTNHWWSLALVPEYPESPTALIVEALDVTERSERSVICCGEACVQKVVGRYLAGKELA